jgi:hypothetical protein
MSSILGQYWILQILLVSNRPHKVVVLGDDAAVGRAGGLSHLRLLLQLLLANALIILRLHVLLNDLIL